MKDVLSVPFPIIVNTGLCSFFKNSREKLYENRSLYYMGVDDYIYVHIGSHSALWTLLSLGGLMDILLPKLSIRNS